MAVLTNISVGTSDLQAIYPDINNLKFDDDVQTDFSEQINAAKIEVFGKIKVQYKRENPSEADAAVNSALANVKDYPEEEYLKNKTARLAVSITLVANNMLEEAQAHRDIANQIPLLYYIDEDTDSVVDEDEEKKADEFPKIRR